MTKDRNSGRYAPGNVSPDGNYVVGKGKPPESGKFRAGDGRERGVRQKGTKNLATDLREELDARVTVTVAGASKKISRQRAILMRLTDNATRGQNPAIAMTLDYQQRLVDPLIAKEQAERMAQSRPDYSLLTIDERQAMHYLLCKAFGQGLPDDVPQIIYKRWSDSVNVADSRSIDDGGGEELATNALRPRR